MSSQLDSFVLRGVSLPNRFKVGAVCLGSYSFVSVRILSPMDTGQKEGVLVHQSLFN